MFTNIDHIAIAVKNLEEKIHLYEEVFGMAPLGKEVMENEKVNVAYLDFPQSKLELIEPISADSPVHKFIEKKGEGLHHICFAVEQLETTIHLLIQRGVQFIDPLIRPGSGGSRVAFIHPRSTGGILMELKEKHDA